MREEVDVVEHGECAGGNLLTSGCGVVMVCVCMAGTAGAASSAHKSWRASNNIACGLTRSPGREQPPEFDTKHNSR